MRAKLIYCALVLVPALVLGACQNMGAFSDCYQAAHKRAYWAALKGGGSDGAAQAWANLAAHEAAERECSK